MSRKAAIILGVAVALGGAAATAQVRQINVGQALDANPQVGSGGYNTFTPAVGGVNSQLYVTGQVTGLAYFHGRVPYSAPDALQMNVPSSDLGLFRGQSVGVQDVLSQNVAQPAPYYGRQATIAGLQDLASGSLGMNLPKRYADTGAVQNLYINAMANYQSLMTMEPNKAIAPTGLVKSSTQKYLIGPAEDVPAVKPGAFGASVLFGVPTAEGREGLARELREADSDWKPGAKVDAWVDARVKGGDYGRDARAPGDKSGMDKTVPTVPEKLDSRGAAKDIAGYLKSGEVPEANQDVFVDLLVNLQAKRAAKLEGAQGGKEPTGQAPYDIKMPGAGLGPSEGAGKRKVEIAADRSVVIHGLAGSSTDLFNVQMAKGQKRLAEGKFYDAAGEYEIAVTINANNPLAQVGLGLALFAAGEPSRAAMHIQRALQLFPPLMETRLDVKGMMDGAAFKTRLTALDERLSKSPDMMLAFLSSYLHHTVGESADAKKQADALKKLAGSDKLMNSYADFVLTGKLPAAEPRK
ncbi:MAG: tetratricopeptide repeat protein [Phycisphaerae bacterium]